MTRTTNEHHEECESPWGDLLDEFSEKLRVDPGFSVSQIHDWITGLDSPYREDLLVDCLRAHLSVSWKHSTGTTIEEYVEAFGRDFPEFADVNSIDPNLVEWEFITRHSAAHGDHPLVDEYLERFDSFSDAIASVRARVLDERYVRLRRIGKGGFGNVWEAFDQRFGRRVAIKIPFENSQEMSSWDEHFQEEIKTTARLRHPAIVTVHDMSADSSDVPYSVMRFIDGSDLQEEIANAHEIRNSGDSLAWNVELNRLLDSFVTVCEAVSYAHSKGIAHQDLKPQNIMVGTFGETVVLDWGMSMFANSSESSGSQPFSPIPGTPNYMPPEAAQGIVDQRSDVFCLGGILYEILTGLPPRQTDLAGEDNLLSSLTYLEVRKPRDILDGIDRELETICLRALNRDPEQRFQSVGAISDAIAVYRAKVKQRAVEQEVRIAKDQLRIRLLRRWIWSFACLVLMLFIAIVLFALSERRANLLSDESEKRAVLAERYADLNSESIHALTAPLFDAELYVLHLPPEQLNRIYETTESTARELEASDRPESQFDSARAYMRMGYLLRRQRQYEHALEKLRIAYGLLNSLEAIALEERAITWELAHCSENIAYCERDMGNTREALVAYGEAVEHWRAVVETPQATESDRIHFMRCRCNRASVLHRANRTEEALHEITDVLINLGDDEPTSFLWAGVRAGAFTMKARMVKNISDRRNLYEKAIVDFRKALDLNRLDSTNTKKEFSECLSNYANSIAQITGLESKCSETIAEAMRMARELRAMHPNHDEFKRLEATILIVEALALDFQKKSAKATKNLSAAEDLLTQLAENCPLDVETSRTLSTLYERRARNALHTRDLKSAKQFVDKAYNAGSKGEQIQILKTAIQIENKDYAAIIHSMRAMNLKRPASNYNLSMLCDVCQQYIQQDSLVEENRSLQMCAELGALERSFMLAAIELGFFDDEAKVLDLKNNDGFKSLRAMPEYEQYLEQAIQDAAKGKK